MSKVIKTGKLVQLPFRCSDEIRIRLHRAIGKEMSRTGRRVSANELIVKFLEQGLEKMGE